MDCGLKFAMSAPAVLNDSFGAGSRRLPSDRAVKDAAASASGILNGGYGADAVSPIGRRYPFAELA
jgi:hypothetical protein